MIERASTRIPEPEPEAPGKPERGPEIIVPNIGPMPGRPEVERPPNEPHPDKAPPRPPGPRPFPDVPIPQEPGPKIRM